MATKTGSQLKGIKVIEDDTTPEVLAQSIVSVAESARKLLSSRLSERAILILIQDAVSGPPLRMTDIQLVLRAAANLDGKYLKKQPAK